MDRGGDLDQGLDGVDATSVPPLILERCGSSV